MAKGKICGVGFLVAAGVACVMAACGSLRAGSLVGALYVKTLPEGAVIAVAGEVKGVSPCGIPQVGIGTVEVAASREGYATQRIEVEVVADEVKVVELTLKPLQNVGNLVVLVTPPGSDIEVDRVPCGRTPKRVINVSAGTHQVKISRPGYRPMHVSVTVTAGQDNEVKGKLAEGEGLLTALPGGYKPEELEEKKLEKEQIPSVDQMPEAKAFEHVRDLISQRRYQEALSELDDMAGEEIGSRYGDRIARDRRFIGQIQQVVKAGWEGLKRKIGQQYELLLRNGISLKGKILDVTEEQIVIDIHADGKGLSVPQAKVHADRLVRFAAYSMDQSKPENQAKFALLFAAEGDYDKAYAAIRRAAEGGYPVAEVKNFIDSERLWAAAKQKELQEAEKKARQALQLERIKEIEERRALEKERKAPPVVLMDRGRGGYVPRSFTSKLEIAGMTVTDKYGAIRKEDLEGADLVIIRDPGPGRPVPPYDESEVKDLVEFVHNGGALVLIGACRAPERGQRGPPPGNPFNVILMPFGIQVRGDSLSVSDKAPNDQARDVFVCYPAQQHPITRGIKKLVFRGRTPSLSLKDPRWGLARASRFVGSHLAGPSPWVAAAAQFGRGRVVVFASMPELFVSDYKGSPLYENHGEKMLLNALTWAALAGRS